MQDELPSNSFDMLFAKARYAVALQDSDSKSLELSASGGAFALFARSVLRVGGAVFGASLLDNGTVRHICIKRIDDLYKLQGSKYVKSNVADTYEECAHLLCKNTVVLYSGTPCQIAGLRKYLEKSVPKEVVANNLLCVDLICHGTPKQKIFSAYLEWLATKNKAEVLGPARDDPYFAAFTKGVIYRRCCYKCPFARLERVGDITIGDYWGIDSVHPGFSDGRGVSAVLINTSNAERFFNECCADECKWIKSTVESVAANNSNLVKPASRSDDDERLADEVERAISAGDHKLAFEKLLAPKLSLMARIRRMLPWKLVRMVYGHGR